MNKRLQAILDLIQQSESLTPEEKKSLADAVTESDKEITITEFKLERTEKVKRTTGILLEETIAELEQKRKSVELQNRELEIEAALERVRSRSIAMRQSSELGDLSFELVKQVQALGIATWHCAFNIYDEGQESSTEWGSNANGSYPIYKTPREGIFKRYYEIGQRGEVLHVELIGEDRCADHYAYLCTLPGVGDTLVKVRDSGTPFPKSQIDHVAYFKYGYLLFITFEPAPEAYDVFKRFAKVFEQTYTRFLDLQQAEVQTREAQIQLALERVRARTMAMQNSDELREVVATLYEQLSQLNFDSNACNIIIIDNKTNNQQYWVSGFMQKLYPESYNVPYFEHSYIDVQLQSWKQGEKYTVIEYSGKTKKEFDKQFFSQTEFKNIPQEVQEIIKTFESATLSTAFFTYGALQIIGPSSLSDENAEILQRFASVFEQTYTRFLDLQKAEAQAREAQVEAALEKVRSRSLAMHKAEELGEVITVIFDKLKDLNFSVADGVALITFIEGSKDLNEWMANPGFPSAIRFFLPYFEHPVLSNLWNAKNQGKEFLEGRYTAEENRSFLNHIFEYSDYRHTPQEIKDFCLAAGFYNNSIVFQKNTAIFINDYTGHSLSEHEIDILKRVSKVFEQTYTRFLDLQKAEGQAREAKIETALERVRSRTMAMHKSDELIDVISILNSEVQTLGVEFDTGSIVTDYNSNSDPGFTTWISVNGQILVHVIKGLIDHAVMHKFTDAIQSGTKFYTEVYSREEKNEYLTKYFELAGNPVTAERRKILFDAPGWTRSVVGLSTNAHLAFARFSTVLFSDEDNELFKRFGKVFDQTYTRFLDLQKAEAQAREAKIEAALEKVRSRSLAMHKSDELQEVVNSVFDRFKELEIETDTATIYTVKEGTKDLDCWLQTAEQTYSSGIVFPYFDQSILSRETLIRGEGFVSKTYTKNEKDEWFNLMFLHSDMRKIPETRKQFILNAEAFTGSRAHMKYTSISIFRYSQKEFTVSEHDVLRRFAKVFEQAYIRFLDLKKAEAQARESQIQLALERVRARTMAMQHSDELKDVAHELRVQLAALGTDELETCAVNLYEEHDEFIEAWVAVRPPDSPKDISEFHFLLPKKGIYIIEDMLQAYTSHVEEFVFELGGPKGVQWMNTMETLVPDMFAVAAAAPDFKNTGTVQAWFCCQFFSGGALIMITMTPPMEESRLLMKRCTQVFSLAYRRFADLKKAEAQTRLAQIEVSLERVRARAMGMHHSDELSDVLSVLFDQFDVLGIRPVYTFLSLIDLDKNKFTYRQTGKGGQRVIAQQVIDLDKMEEWKDLFESMRAGKIDPINCLHYPKESLEKVWEVFDEIYTALPEGSKVYPEDFPDGVYTTQAYCKFGYLGFDHIRAASEEDKDILQRFANEFTRLYQRFLDLQKAEAQAREAKIETALERIRAKAIGMHHSNELSDVLTLLFQQYDLLDIHPVNTMLNLFDIDKNQFTHFTTGRNGMHTITQQTLALDASDIWRSAVDEWKQMKPQSISTVHYPVEVIPHIFELFKELRSGIAESERNQVEDFPLGMFQTIANCKFGSIGFLHSREATEEEKEITARFAKEFERLYQRFLDLQKAEAQAREAQIEAALEKVRSRTLAMHTAQELGEVVLVIVEKLKELGVILDANGVVLCTYFQNSKNVLHWIASPDFSFAGSYLLPYFDHPIFKDAWESKMSGADYFSKPFSVEEKNSFFEYAFEHSDYKYFPDEFKQWILQNDKHSLSFAWQKNSAILIPSHTGIVPGEGEKEILKRFSKVFEQAYIRFLDIQKAEAQAREAQIEAALERVRSRAMAMQTSEELNALIGTVFTELTKLDLVLTRCVIMTYDHKTKDARWWMANSEAPEQPMNFQVQYHEHPPNVAYFSAWRERTVKWIYPLEGTIKKQWDDFLFSETELKLLPDFVIAGMKAPDRVYLNASFYNSGNLTLASLEPLSDDHFDILIRFAKVFDLTYTRFNDLKQAEAQAREAKIEAALERVRSRTMGMQHSEELVDVASILFQQVKTLGVPQWNCGFNIWEIGDKEFTYYPGSPDGIISPSPCNIPLTEHPVFISFDESRKRGDELFVYEKEGEFQADHYRYMLSLRPGVGDLLQSMLDAGFQLPTFQIDHVANFSYGNLIFITYEHFPEMHDVFKRFAKVFEQTYTRFLDLKKAEAQAREAQIETALEKVRSRSLAMHKSDELQEVINALFERLKELEIETDTAAILISKKGTKDIEAWIQNQEHTYSSSVLLPYNHESILSREVTELRATATDLITKNYTVAEKNEYFNHLFQHSDMKNIPESRKMFVLQAQGYTVSNAHSKHSGILLGRYTDKPFSAGEHKILKRFAGVFEQAYIRFSDLQKAEAQARESQIEVSLERVRSKAMAMHKSEDLTAAVAVVFEELEKLDIGMSRCGIGILDKEKRSADVWTTSKSEGQNAVDVSGDESMDIHPLLQKAFDAWLRQEDFSYVLQGEDLADYYKALQHTNFRLPESEAMVKNSEILHHHYYVASFQAGALYAFRDNPFTDEAKNVMKRFTNVFNLTYKRYQDIQKAEAQARDAEIELALERIRAKATSMRNSAELLDIIHKVFEEWKKLGLDLYECNINLLDRSTRTWTNWGTGMGEATLPKSYTLAYFEHPFLRQIYDDTINNVPSRTIVVEGEDYKRFLQRLFNETDFRNSPKEYQDALWSINKIYSTHAYMQYGSLDVVTHEPLPDATGDILKRFAKVFEQAYTRYLDLVQAEAQAMESQIEAALERVRSRTMAMHRSEEIADIVSKIFKELTLLDVALNRVLIWIFNPDERYFTWWSANPEAEGNGESYRVDYFEHPVFLTYYEAWQKRSPLFLYTLADDLKESFENHLFKNTELSRIPKAVQDGMRSEKKIFTTSAISDYGLLMAGCFEPFSDEINDIIQRFGRVFQQSYTRYVDVQKAEAQAREATIEASLEKVRGKAMAMHNSNDLVSTASLVFTELRKLGIESFRSGVGLLTKENRNVKLYSASSSEEGGSFSVVGWAVLDHHPVLTKTYDSWVNNEDYFPVLKGELLKSYYEKIVATFTVPVEQSEGYEQHGYFLPFSEGLFYGWSEKPFIEQEIKILNRFRGIVDLTFRRYMELQKSEENAMEAIRQASLDRVRAEIASMRTTTDLDRITPLIWKELNILNIPFVRCGVFIMDDFHQLIHTFLSTPEGKAIAAFHLPYETPGNIGDLLNHWRTKQMYIRHWDATAFSELGELLVQQGAIPSKEVYMNTVPVDGIHLHCLPFMQGMLYVGNTTQLQESDIHLIQSVADAFSTAYARYEDFNKLESAKAQIEKTLTDLKLTQNQLVQSEKMASLGELTAGIAHEIQNPLNFVNNFSEVSNELLEEMKEEIQKGNYDDVEAITNNIKQNLEKILHHGKRADGIVKGMLQHSRSSSGVKEPTDINALADEYLRLAYHGFRAKDKSFNASTNTDLDKTIGKINVVPQEIGRVVLNLITNAFYAVTEKQNQSTPEYRPTVHLSTKRNDDCVLISVKDNGNGIPKHIREKIFQPFFTTKPTGQGTGLGLSLSYDIVKAHGGELKVETKEGEGSEFIISIML